MGTTESPEPIPARMLNELVYCPRLFWLEHVAGEWDDNADTERGKRVHRTIDVAPKDLPPPDEATGAIQRRSIVAAAPALGIVAKTDLVEVEGDTIRPVDYKKGAAPDSRQASGGIWPADRIQLGAQMLALRANGYRCEEGAIYYAKSRRRVSLPYGEQLEADVKGAVEEARRVSASKIAPPPLVDSPKCPGCSLVGICLPDETHLLQIDAAPADDARAVRRLIPPQLEGRPIVVATHGATVGKEGDELEVRIPAGEKSRIRLQDVLDLAVFGNVQVTNGALRELAQRGIDVSFFSSGGWHYGTFTGVPSINVLTRIEQFKVHAEPKAALMLARAFVVAKIQNARTLLRRHASGDACADRLAALKQLQREAADVESIESLLGIEGMAAKVYFQGFAGLIAPRSGASPEFDFDGRNRRPPKDPVNAMLSFTYAILMKDVRIALAAVGLDPMVGFLHQVQPGRPALALDMMEEFRPLLADSAVLTAINTDVVKPADFVRAAGAVAMSDRGRKGLLGAYARRMEQEVTHPLFGYQVSYRQILRIQARLLARTITGEIPRYPGFVTR